MAEPGRLPVLVRQAGKPVVVWPPPGQRGAAVRLERVSADAGIATAQRFKRDAQA
jgi:hypothetical protein